MAVFREEDHPRAEDGKFTAGAGASKKTDGGAISTDKPRLVHNEKEFADFYEETKAGKTYTREELLAHPVLKMLDEKANEYTKKYGDTSTINTPEREALRESILKDFLSAKPMIYENGHYVPKGKIKKEHKVVVAIGLPASGKSSRIANPASEDMGAFIFDSDEVKQLIPEFKESNGGAANSVHKESKDIVAKAFSQFLAGGARNGENLVVPVIGDDYEGLMKKWVSPLENAGYDVEIRFADTDPVRSLQNSMSRAVKTGRIIPSSVSTSYEDKPRQVFEMFKKMKNKRGNNYVR